MDLSRIFTAEVNGKQVHFKATYNPQTHFFNVIEDDSHSYTLAFDPNTKVWTATGGFHGTSVLRGSRLDHRVDRPDVEGRTNDCRS
jgi:hypothetical protein